ncbi:MAG: flagellar motor switch protein FliG [Candidatus Riflebacteria bacterium]|nr:flagellar motor switch protein FliG [Candidatus Riflebacteria bacterium]
MAEAADKKQAKTSEDASELSGRAKAAILTIILDPAASGLLMQGLTEEELEILTAEMRNHKKVSTEQKIDVFLEFEQLMMGREFYAEGGLEYAKKLLEKTLGPKKAAEIINKIQTPKKIQPFEAARQADPLVVASLIQNEHPQTIALILAYLQPANAALILQSMPQETQVRIAKRLALMERTSPEIISEVERYLKDRLTASAQEHTDSPGGIDSLINILNAVERPTEKNIIETMEVQEPGLAEEIKKRIFVFEDVILIDDRGIQNIFKHIDLKDLALALKGVNDDVQDKFFRNMSERAREMLKEDMTYMGPVRIADVDKAQQRIVGVIKNLDSKGEIIISRPGEEDFVE